MTVEVVIRGEPKWARYTNADLGVSVGSGYFEGELLETTLDWMRDQFPHRRRAIIADTLYRWNLMRPGVTEDEAHTLAVKRGDEWVARNRRMLDHYGFEVVRWDDIRCSSNMTLSPDVFENLKKQSERYARLLDADIRHHLETLAKRGEIIDWHRDYQQSEKFIEEELRIDTELARNFPEAAYIYPGPSFRVYKDIRAGRIPEAPQGLERQYHTYIELKEPALLPAMRPHQAYRIA